MNILLINNNFLIDNIHFFSECIIVYGMFWKYIPITREDLCALIIIINNHISMIIYQWLLMFIKKVLLILISIVSCVLSACFYNKTLMKKKYRKMYYKNIDEILSIFLGIIFKLWEKYFRTGTLMGCSDAKHYDIQII